MSSVTPPTRSSSGFALDVSPVQQQPLAVREVVVPAPIPKPAMWNRETATHATLAIAQIGAVGGLAYLATSSVTLVAAALAGAVATGVAIAKAFGGRGANDQVAAALNADRQALAATRDLLAKQTAAIASDRARLDHERANVQSQQEQLAGERETFNQRVAFEANKVIEPAKQALAEERATLDKNIATFEARRQGIIASLQAEAEKLTISEITAIREASLAYCNSSEPYHRFAPQAYDYGYPQSEHTPIKGENALATLVGTGQLYAGVCKLVENEWTIPRGGTTLITSVQQLRTFLRVATGREV